MPAITGSTETGKRWNPKENVEWKKKKISEWLLKSHMPEYKNGTKMFTYRHPIALYARECIVLLVTFLENTSSACFWTDLWQDQESKLKFSKFSWRCKHTCLGSFFYFSTLCVREVMRWGTFVDCEIQHSSASNFLHLDSQFCRGMMHNNNNN